MNYFQQYEQSRKHLKVGKRWICVDPGAIGQNIESLGEIIKIIDIIDNPDNPDWRACRYYILTDKFKSQTYVASMSSFTQCYKPYIGAMPTEDEELTNDWLDS